MMKKAQLLLFTLLFLSFSNIVLTQVTYQGPASGNVTSGVMVTTDNFLKIPPIGDPIIQGSRNVEGPQTGEMIIDFPTLPKETIYFGDPNVYGDKRGGSGQTVLLQDFQGIPMTNSIPPDPNIAVGPDHVIATVNSRFAIWDKQGNLLKNISADQWYASVLPGPGPFDPQIIYDHYAGRWFMLWDSQNDNPQRAHFLISVSDDDNPLGVWYNYALPANQNGMTVVNNWGDYPQIGFDEEAIYINSRQFVFGGNKVYDKIRILNKADLYSANGGQVNWVDIWDITYPHNASRPDVIHPVISYSTSSEFYLVHTPNNGGNILSIYRITNPLTNPVLTGTNISVSFYGAPPDANQLGGGTPLISSNGSGMKTKPIYRDGFIWATHSVRHPSSILSTSLRYYKINVGTNSIVEDVTFGATDHWYLFPTLTVDKDQNIAITYSRSSLTEYMGAFYSTRLANDPPGLSGSTPLKEGQGNYVVTFGGARNRWGDYLGIYLDPVTEYNIWMLPEYAAATNTWGTWIGEIRMVPFTGIYGFVSESELDFGSVEINFTSETLSFILSNYGEENLVINSIPDSVGPFKLISNLSFPITLSSYDSLTVDFQFAPTVSGVYDEILSINTNQVGFTDIIIKGRGFQINTASSNILYASTGGGNNGLIITVDLTNGTGTSIGPSLFNEVTSLSIHPLTNIMYGIVTSLNETQLVRINALGGDSFTLHTIPIGNFADICFDSLGTLYGIVKTGEIYTVDLTNGNAELAVSASANISGAAFHPSTNELWASALVIVGANKDRIFKINLVTGDTTIIGNTGLNVVNNDIIFDRSGNLYAVTGSASQPNNLIQINTQTAEGTLIGSVGFQNITGLAYLPSDVTSVDDDLVSIPNEFSLQQNYPNPFNPLTKIEFSLPVSSNVKLIIYNILGETVNVLFNNQLSAGIHSLNWDSTDRSGNKVGSGVYFYELKASGNNGKDFSDLKKMILLK